MELEIPILRKESLTVIRNTILLVSDEMMIGIPPNEVSDRLLSLFSSPLIEKDDILYPDFVGDRVLNEDIGIFCHPVPACTVFAFRADWQDVDTALEIAYIKRNDTTMREVSLIGMYAPILSRYPDFVRSIFDETVWEELPVLTHETFHFYVENLGVYVNEQTIPYLGQKYNTIIDLSTAGCEEWCSMLASHWNSARDRQ